MGQSEEIAVDNLNLVLFPHSSPFNPSIFFILYFLFFI